MDKQIKQEYDLKIAEAKTLEHPRVLVNVCSHGNEIIGLDIIKLCQNLKINNGSLVFNIANPQAVKLGKRIVESDLNRSFPGNLDGSYEEQIAFQMMEFIPLFDYVIDIHSTDSDIKNCIIIEDDSVEVQKLISVCDNCDTVLHMNVTKGSSIFTACRTKNKIIPGVAFEYGDNSVETSQRTYDDLYNILAEVGLVQNTGLNKGQNKPNQFNCYKVFPKSLDDVLSKLIKNYSLVSKGTIIGYTVNNEEIHAPEDFYPVLFGETNYNTIFGFMAKKIN